MNTFLAQLAGLFTAPALAVAGVACVAIPVIIHLLSRTRRTRAEWGAMRFLRLAFKKQKRKLRMEKWLLLLTRCAVMVIAGLALAGPLLSGAWVWGGLTSGGGGGRTVHLVIEDGLSTRAAVGDGVRLDRLRETALELLDGLSPNDAVQVWLTATPGIAPTPAPGSNQEGETNEALTYAHPATPSPTLDRGKVRGAIEELEPGYGRSRLAEALGQVAAAVEAESDAGRRPPVVAVLSDFARGVEDLEEALPAELATLGERATLIVTRPDVGSGNVQVQSLRPRRSLVLTGNPASGSFGSGALGPAQVPTVSVEVVLRRFDDTTAAAAGEVALSLTPPTGEAWPAVTRPVAWSAGQTTATLSVDLPLVQDEAPPPSDVAAGTSGNISGGGMWTLTANLSAEAGVADAVAEDDQRFAVVQVRPRLNVGVIDDGANLGDGRIGPAAFVRAALSPEQTGERFAVAADTLLPATVDEDRLSNFDAAIVLRPDLLGAAGWSALGAFAEAGGLVWVFPPASDTPAADWFGVMANTMGVGWTLGDAGDTLVNPSIDGRGERARLETDQRPPDELLLLAADWSALLAPIRVERWATVSVDEPDQVWIRLGGEGGDSFLSSARVGEGRLILGASALDPTWTNLPTKPVFPALLHDALRGTLGSRPTGSETVVGDRPTLGRPWAGVARLRAIDSETDMLLSEGETVSPIARPGVYGPSVAGGAVTDGQRLAVNVPADAGDVRATSEAQLAEWLDGLGAWEFVETENPTSVFATAERGSNLGWALLWVLLALVLAEMVMARVFSHAASPRRGRAGEQENRRARKTIVKRFSPFKRAAGVLPFLFSGSSALLLSPKAQANAVDDLLGLTDVSFAEATALGWRYPLPAWAWVLIVAASLAVAWWSYRRLLGPTWARVGLSGLRGLLLVLIAVLLAGPEVVRTDETIEQDVLLVLVDRSASMTVADAADDEGGLVRREDAIRTALRDQGEVFGDEQLGRGRQVAWLGFGEQAFELASPVGEAGLSALGEPADQTTALRTALEAALRRGAGQPISGIVLMSDGRSPEATDADLLAKLEQQSVRVYSVPLGAERLPMDLALSRVEAPATAFINDAVPVTVVVDQPGALPDDAAIDPSRVTVRLIDTATGDVIDEKTLEDVGLGQPLRLEGRSGQTGELPWAVEVIYESVNGDSEGEQELNRNNNTEAFVVNLIDRPIRVLYIEGYPRWEYRYLKNMLIREQSIDSSIMLLSADRAFAQEGDTPITRLPNEPEEWRRYDVVVVGDVPADAFSAEQRKQLHDLVSQRGAGVLWVAGQGSMPTSYAATMLSDLLPMRDPEAVSVLPWARAAVQPTALAETLSVLQLRSAGAAEGETPDWPRDLPGLRWVQDVGELKPSAEVLADAVSINSIAFPNSMLDRNPRIGEIRDANLEEIFEGDMPEEFIDFPSSPLITRLRFGAGQSLYVATDETWRWRYARGEVYFEQFWVQLVRMLGRAAATRSDEPVRLAVSTRSTPVGGTVVVDLDVEDAALIARDLPSVKVAVREVGDPLEQDLAEFELRPTPGSPPGSDDAMQTFSAAWLANVPGELELVVTDPALSGLGLRVPLDVVASDDELRRAEADVARLVRLAEATGGRVVPLDDLQQLAEPGVVRNLARKTANDVAEPIWNSTFALLLVVGLITLEWIGRKLVRLV